MAPHSVSVDEELNEAAREVMVRTSHFSQTIDFTSFKFIC